MDAPLLPALPGYDNPQLIAHGTTALVFRALQTRLNRHVAIKVITADTGSVPVNAARELATTVALSSQPHIVSIIDTGVTDDDRPYIVMEYCEGGSYAQILRHGGPLPIDDVLEVGIKIGEALHAAHQAGIVHRDVKPSNILRSRFGPALTDFGIARAPDELGGTLTREMMTPHHASPEALLHQAQSGISDIYSLASTMWTLLTGHPPFVDPSRPPVDMYAFRDRVLHDQLPSIGRDDVPTWLVGELTRAMSKLPAQRHGSAFEFAEALRRGALGLSPTPPAGFVAPVRGIVPPPASARPSAGSPQQAGRPDAPGSTSGRSQVHVPGVPPQAWPAADAPPPMGMPPPKVTPPPALYRPAPRNPPAGAESTPYSGAQPGAHSGGPPPSQGAGPAAAHPSAAASTFTPAHPSPAASTFTPAHPSVPASTFAPAHPSVAGQTPVGTDPGGLGSTGDRPGRPASDDPARPLPDPASRPDPAGERASWPAPATLPSPARPADHDHPSREGDPSRQARTPDNAPPPGDRPSWPAPATHDPASWPGTTGDHPSGAGDPSRQTRTAGSPPPPGDRPSWPAPATEDPAPWPGTTGDPSRQAHTADNTPSPSDRPSWPAPATEDPARPAPVTDDRSRRATAADRPPRPGSTGDHPSWPASGAGDPSRPGRTHDTPSPGDRPSWPAPATEDPARPAPATDHRSRPAPTGDHPSWPARAVDDPAWPGSGAGDPSRPATERPSGSPSLASAGGTPRPAPAPNGPMGHAPDAAFRPGAAPGNEARPGTDRPSRHVPGTNDPSRPVPGADRPTPAADAARPGATGDRPSWSAPTVDRPRPSSTSDRPSWPAPAADRPSWPSRPEVRPEARTDLDESDDLDDPAGGSALFSGPDARSDPGGPDQGGWLGPNTSWRAEPDPPEGDTSRGRFNEHDLVPRGTGRRSALLAVLIGVAVLAVAGAAGVLLSLQDRGTAVDQVAGTASVGPTRFISAQASGSPRDIRVSDDRGTSVTLSWTDPTAGTVTFVVVGTGPGGEKLATKSIHRGTTTVTYTQLNAAKNYCFVVGAVYAVDTVALAPEICTKR